MKFELGDRVRVENATANPFWHWTGLVAETHMLDGQPYYRVEAHGLLLLFHETSLSKIVMVILLLCVSASAQNLTRPAITPPKPDTTWNWQFKESSAEFIGSFTLDCLSTAGLFEHNRLLRNSHGGIRMGGCFVANGAAYGLTVLLQKKHPKIANWMRRFGAVAHVGAAAHNFAVKGGKVRWHIESWLRKPSRSR